MWDGGDADPDLKEHMVGILFSRSGKLSHLQKQVGTASVYSTCNRYFYALEIT